MTTGTSCQRTRALVRFMVVDPPPRRNQASSLVSIVSMATILLLGAAMMAVEGSASFAPTLVQSQPVTVHLHQLKAPAPFETAPILPPPSKTIPVLEPETVLSAPEDRPAVKPENASTAAPQELVAETIPPTARRVYGVRKIYAQGMGQVTANPTGLVTKLGNSIAGVGDTLMATPADLQGELAPLSSVDQAPQPIRRTKPVYSPVMLKNRVRGLVSAYLLIDVDGSVKKVNVTEDIGYDSRQVATKALIGFRFKPAFKNGNPVAVWILHRIRFEFQE